MIGFYNYTVILTYAGLTSALIGIFATLQNHPIVGLICLMVAGLCDMFDGKVARTRERTREEKNFGIQIDSLCDLVCFGVLPTVIAFSVGLRQWYYIPILILFVLCGLIRLAYYNVTEIVREQETDEVRRAYLGLPITFSAVFVPLAYTLRGFLPERWFAPFFGVVLLAIGVAYITPFSISKPGKFKITFLIVLGALLTAFFVWSAFHSAA